MQLFNSERFLSTARQLGVQVGELRLIQETREQLRTSPGTGGWLWWNQGAESARRESGSVGLKDRLSVGHNRTVATCDCIQGNPTHNNGQV